MSRKQNINEKRRARERYNKSMGKVKANLTGVFYGPILKSFMEKRCNLPNGIKSK